MHPAEHQDSAQRPHALQPASPWRRLGAYLLDALVLFAWTVLVFLAVLSIAPESAPSVPLSLIGFISALAYLFVGWAVSGMTLGKWAMGIRVVTADGRKLPWLRALGRVGAFLIASAPLKLGLAAIIWDGRHRGWHDHLAGTMVVGPPPRSAEPVRVSEAAGPQDRPDAAGPESHVTPPLPHGRLVAGLMLVAYVGIAVAFTLPLASHFSTHIPGAQVEGLEQDGYMFLWDYWWVRTALTHPGVHVMSTRYLFWPEDVSLRYHTLVLLHSSAAALLQSALTLIQTYNLLLLFSLAACAWGAFLLCRYLTGATTAAALAGLAFGFCPYMTTHALAHQNLIAAEWMAPLAYCALRGLRERRLRYVLGAGASWALIGLCDWYYFLYGAMLVGVFAAVEVAARPRRWLGALAAGVGSLALGAILLSPLLAPMIAERAHGAYMQQPLARGAALASQPGLYLTPAFTHPLFGGAGARVLHSLGYSRAEATLYLGLTVLALAIVGAAYRRRRLAPFTMGAVFFLVLALGPYLRLGTHTEFNAFALLLIGGPPGNGLDLPISAGLSARLAMTVAGGGDFLHVREAIPLPYLWLWHYVPITRLAAVPTRAVLPGMLCLVALAAAGLQVLLSATGRRARPVIACLAAGLVIFEFLPVPYPMRDLPVPPLYRELARSRRFLAVAEVPLFGDYMVYMYHQTVHHKPILAGHVSRLPPHALDFVRSNALLRDLQPNREAQPGTPVLFLTAKAPPGADVGQLRREYAPALRAAQRSDVGVVVVHSNMLTPADMAAVRRVLHEALGLPAAQEPGDITAYYLAPVLR
jgi:uncharacterized RDD family membrane protein YckC